MAAFGEDKLAILKFAALAVLVIAALGALSSYAESLTTTGVGQARGSTRLRRK